MLRTLPETFFSRAWCLSQRCEGSAMLTFPSYFRRERKEKRLYVQLKPGDSYLKKRQRDGVEVFQIKNPRWGACARPPQV